MYVKPLPDNFQVRFIFTSYSEFLRLYVSTHASFDVYQSDQKIPIGCQATKLVTFIYPLKATAIDFYPCYPTIDTGMPGAIISSGNFLRDPIGIFQELNHIQSVGEAQKLSLATPRHLTVVFSLRISNLYE